MRRGAAGGAQGPRAHRCDGAEATVESFLKEQKIAYGSAYLDNGRLMVRFQAVPQQLQARDAVNQHFDKQLRHGAVVRAAHAGVAARSSGLRPMPLGLDLRGGLYLLYQVDMASAHQPAAGRATGRTCAAR